MIPPIACDEGDARQVQAGTAAVGYVAAGSFSGPSRW